MKSRSAHLAVFLTAALVGVPFALSDDKQESRGAAEAREHLRRAVREMMYGACVTPIEQMTETQRANLDSHVELWSVPVDLLSNNLLDERGQEWFIQSFKNSGRLERDNTASPPSEIERSSRIAYWKRNLPDEWVSPERRALRVRRLREFYAELERQLTERLGRIETTAGVCDAPASEPAFAPSEKAQRLVRERLEYYAKLPESIFWSRSAEQLERERDWAGIVSALLKDAEFPRERYVDGESSDWALSLISSTAIRLVMPDEQELIDHDKALRQIRDSFAQASEEARAGLGPAASGLANSLPDTDAIKALRMRLKKNTRMIIEFQTGVLNKPIEPEQKMNVDQHVELWCRVVDALPVALLTQDGFCWFESSLNDEWLSYARAPLEAPSEWTRLRVALLIEGQLAEECLPREVRDTRERNFRQACENPEYYYIRLERAVNKLSLQDGRRPLSSAESKDFVYREFGDALCEAQRTATRRAGSIFQAKAGAAWDQPQDSRKLVRRVIRDVLRPGTTVQAERLVKSAEAFYDLLFWAAVDTADGRRTYRTMVRNLRDQLIERSGDEPKPEQNLSDEDKGQNYGEGLKNRNSSAICNENSSKMLK